MIRMEKLEKRLRELAEKSYQNNQYLFTNFLNMEELDLFYRIQKEFSYVPCELTGGTENCERQVVRFGSAELFGYEESFPICCLGISPILEKFAEELSHRDYLGALMNLGIEREVLGDIWIKGKTAYVFCLEKIADYIVGNLNQVRHTQMKVTKLREIPEVLCPEFLDKEVTAASERIDAVLGKVCNLSRSQSIQAFREKKIFVNGRQCENNSYLLKPGDRVTYRGFGKFIYQGILYQTKKGKICAGVSIYK